MLLPVVNPLPSTVIYIAEWRQYILLPALFAHCDHADCRKKKITDQMRNQIRSTVRAKSAPGSTLAPLHRKSFSPSLRLCLHQYLGLSLAHLHRPQVCNKCHVDIIYGIILGTTGASLGQLCTRRDGRADATMRAT